MRRSLGGPNDCRDDRRLMSIHFKHRRMMAPDIAARKGGEPIVALTSYHAHTAAIADNHCDFLLVGDSLGMVMHDWSPDRIRPFVLETIDVFGTDRCIFASNFPVDSLVTSYPAIVAAFAEAIRTSPKIKGPELSRKNRA